MVKIGQYNTLKIIKILSFGAYVDGGELGEILLPIKYLQSDAEIDDSIEVFIYKDSEDRLIATTEKPYAQVGEFAYLEVQEVNKFGAFLDWGLVKNLLVPFREQKETMQEGKSYIVYLYVDEKTDRIAATAKVDKYLDLTPAEYEINQQVELLIKNKTELGYNAIVNNLHSGLLYENEVFQKIYIGQSLKGYIKKVREDGKIDLSLAPAGFENIEVINNIIINQLQVNNGFIPLTDKSSPDEIYKLLGISKKNFKKSIGNLYKKKKLLIENNGIRLIE